ncbi:MAG: glycosyltransferase family 39 protein [bacterium]
MRSKTSYTSFPLIFLLCIVLFVVIVRIRLLNVPLERDEGEYAYIGQLILDGIPPYQEAYNMKFPGMYFLYAGILWIFGETHTAIHTALLIANIFTLVLLFILARSAYDDWVAVSAAGAFALLSLSYHVQGFWANAEHFILPFVIGAYLLLFVWQKKKSRPFLLMSGIFLGCAALIKQHGAFFSLVGFLILFQIVWQQRKIENRIRWNALGTLMAGFMIPLLLCGMYLAFHGVLQQFFRWTFLYAKAYSSIVSLNQVKENFLSSFLPLWQHSILLWILACVGALSLYTSHSYRQSRLFLTAWIFSSTIALSIGFYYRPHYFILILPVAALLFGLGIRSIVQTFSGASTPLLKYLPPVIILGFSLISTLVAHWDVLIQFSPAEVTRTTYLQNPFLYSERIAELIEERSTSQDRIAIIGNEPQILFYAHRRSATPYIYTYSLMEDQPLARQFRSEMIKQIESSTPKLLIFTQLQPEWYQQPLGEQQLHAWFFRYAESLYKPSVRFEYTPGSNDTLLITEPHDLMNRSKHHYWITIYERRTL